MRPRLFLTVALVLFFSVAVNAFAATHYVATTGSDSDPGTEAQPWRTLKYAAANIASRDTVIVHGGVYSEYITIDVPNVTFQNYHGEWPIMDGSHVKPAMDRHLTMVYITADDVTIDGLAVRESSSYGIYINRAENVTIKNVKIYETYRQSLVINNGADNALIENCDIHHGGKVVYEFCGGSGGGCRKLGWGDPPTAMVKRSDRPIFRKTKIHDSYNEGINIDVGSSNAIVEYCEIYGNLKSQLYLCASTNNTVRYNLIYGTDNGSGPGIWFNNESQWVETMGNPLVSNSKVYGNFIANTSTNISIAGNANRQVTNVQVYNNTLVEASIYGFCVQAKTGGGHIFKNNVIWQTNEQIANIPGGKVTCGYNLWSRTPDIDARGSHDLPYALPQLVKTSGWNSLSGGDLKRSDFALQNGSPAIDRGTSLGPQFSELLDCDETVWPEKIVLKNQNKQGPGWEIGADIHVANSTGLDSPTSLKIATGL